MRYLVFLSIVFVLVACKDLEILRYEYQTTTQMGRTVMAVTQDSVIVTFNGRGEPTYFARPVKKEEWKALNVSMEDVKLDEVSTLSSPSNKRATDAAPYAKFKFFGKDSTITSAYFDAGNPHKMLEKLMSAFIEIEANNKD